jgi:hypothetical protein
MKLKMEIRMFRKGIVVITTAILISVIILSSLLAAPMLQNDPNPSSTVIRAYLKEMALKYNIPSVILMGIAYTESGWRQFDSSGNPVINYNSQTSFDIGIMQINSVGKSDIDKLKTDIFYNIEVGAKILDGKWKITPGIGDRDRNVLENWYYAVWAYNGFSYTNNPQNIAGRHYQDKVIDNIARFILGNDGQPLWAPVTITKPDPLTITNPPQWIPTPTPYHYGDLYTGINSGDNARILEAPFKTVIKVNKDTRISFLMQNVGTTVWKKNSAIYAKLTLSKGNSILEYSTYVSKDVVQGDTYTFTFNVNLPSMGIYAIALSMYNGITPFGPNIIGNLEVLDLTVSDLTADLAGGFDIGEKIPISFNLNLPKAFNTFAEVSLIDSLGNTVYTRLIKTGFVQDKINSSFMPLAQLLVPGTYTLNERLILIDGSFDISDSLIYPSYFDAKKIVIIKNTSKAGIMVDSNPQGAHILINGTETGLLTPAFVQLSPASYSISLAKNGFLTQTVTKTIAYGIEFLLQDLPVDNTKFVPSVAPNSVDLGSLNNGDSSFATVSVSFDGVLASPLNVTSDSKWLSIYPYNALKAATFTISVDSRWIGSSGQLQGTITFKANSQTYTVKVTANVIDNSVKLYLLPERATPREGDTVTLEAHINSPTYALGSAAFSLTYDPAFLSYSGSTTNTAYNLTISPSGNGRIDVSFSSANGFKGDDRIALFSFTALSKVSGTLIRLENPTAKTPDNKLLNVQTTPSTISILEQLNLPGSVANLSAEALIGKVQLTFTSASQGSYPIKEYEVYRSKDNSIDDAIYIGSTQTNIFTDNGPLERVQYSYWVITVDTANNSSTLSGPVQVTPLILSESFPKYVKLEFYIGKPIVYINGIQMPMETAPFIKAGRTFVPVRYIAQPFGAQVIWNSKNQQVTLIHKKLIELWIGNPAALIDGVETLIDQNDPTVAPFIQNGRTMLPLRFVSENFGASVIWDQKLQKITIEYNN